MQTWVRGARRGPFFRDTNASPHTALAWNALAQFITACIVRFRNEKCFREKMMPVYPYIHPSGGFYGWSFASDHGDNRTTELYLGAELAPFLTQWRQCAKHQKVACWFCAGACADTCAKLSADTRLTRGVLVTHVSIFAAFPLPHLDHCWWLGTSSPPLPKSREW